MPTKRSTTTGRGSGKRELIESGSAGAKRYVRRDANGRFTSDQVSVGRSLASDNNQRAKSVAKPGRGDRGDRRTKRS